MKRFLVLLAAMLALMSLAAPPARAGIPIQKFQVKAGSTSVILPISVCDTSGDNFGLLSLAYNTASLHAAYQRNNATSATTITLADMTIGTYTDSGFKVMDNTLMHGMYQICVPDAAFAAGAKYVTVELGGATSMADTFIVVDLVAFDPYDSVRMGQTALPNATAGANTGLPVVGTQIPNATAGASNGLLINGSNSGALTIGALTTGTFSTGGNSFTVGAFSCTAGMNITGGGGTTPSLTLDSSSASGGQAFLIKGNAAAPALEIDGKSVNFGSNSPAVQITGGPGAGGSGNASAAVVIAGGASSNSNAAAAAVQITGGANSSTGSAGAGEVVKTGTGSSSTAVAAVTYQSQTTNGDALKLTHVGTGIDFDATTAPAGWYARYFTVDSGTTYASAVAGSVVYEIAHDAATSASTIANAVWDELRSSHVTSGTFGQSVAGIAGVSFPTNFASLSIDSSGRVTLTPTEESAIVTAIFGHSMDGSKTFQQVSDLMFDVLLAGKSTGLTAGSCTASFTKADGTTAAVDFALDEFGNRTVTIH